MAKTNNVVRIVSSRVGQMTFLTSCLDSNTKDNTNFPVLVVDIKPNTATITETKAKTLNSNLISLFLIVCKNLIREFRYAVDI